MTQTKTCQNCKQEFVIEPEDFAFYERIKVPPPTFCPECRFIRRFTWRNERTLYKRTCDLCRNAIISMHPADAPFPVYCRECWYSDKWDAADYGRAYDFSRPFFAQFSELLRATPRLALWQRNVVNSEYSNMVAEVKNVYLSVSVVAGSENVAYSKSVDGSSFVIDSYNVTRSNTCYENVDGEGNYNSNYLILSRECVDSNFLIDCVNCRNCLLSANLRNKEFYIRNRPYSKENYEKELAKLNLGNRAVRDALAREFEDIRKKALFRYANLIKSPGSTGNNLFNVKNGKKCFDVYEAENSKYCYRAFHFKDCMDFNFGQDSELVYEYSTGALKDYNVKFSLSALGGVRDGEYSEYCVSSSRIFGCVAVKHKENAILNRSYSPEEFSSLREKIIAHMNDVPYTDRAGRVYRYGEFFPVELSPFAYNETLAQDFEPLTKEEALQRGYSWREPESKNHSTTMPAGSIPDNAADATAAILQESLGCAHEGQCAHQCSVAFRLTPDELGFYQNKRIPIPNKCPNCRYYERLQKLPPPKLWTRQCVCDYKIHPNLATHPHHPQGQCSNRFETPYAPDRPEIVYCETCYQAEVA